jgi:AMP-activated protein kinase-like protein
MYAGGTMNDQLDRAIHETRAFLGSRPAPDVRAAVMRRIEDLEPLPPRAGVLQRLADLLWSPHEISIRPAFALVPIGAVVILLLVPYIRQSPAVAPEQLAGAPADSHVFVQFHVEADAMRVQLAGSFTNWEPRYDLRQSAPGVWTITVPLTQGVHDYAFVVDGQQWVADPHEPQIGDGFGGTNNRLALLSPDTPQL